METENKEEIEKRIQEYELQRLRKANSKWKLENIDLRQKLKEIYSVLTANTDNLIQQ
jgi:guanylate kinase